jgi:ABC-type proline/glycine betaine transport system permease subunit
MNSRLPMLMLGTCLLMACAVAAAYSSNVASLLLFAAVLVGVSCTVWVWAGSRHQALFILRSGLTIPSLGLLGLLIAALVFGLDGAQYPAWTLGLLLVAESTWFVFMAHPPQEQQMS